jgi:hypothetical protein
MDKTTRAELYRAMMEYADRHGLKPSGKSEESCHPIPGNDQPVPEKTSASEVRPTLPKSRGGKQSS